MIASWWGGWSNTSYHHVVLSIFFLISIQSYVLIHLQLSKPSWISTQMCISQLAIQIPTDLKTQGQLVRKAPRKKTTNKLSNPKNLEKNAVWHLQVLRIVDGFANHPTNEVEKVQVVSSDIRPPSRHPGRSTCWVLGRSKWLRLGARNEKRQDLLKKRSCLFCCNFYCDCKSPPGFSVHHHPTNRNNFLPYFYVRLKNICIFSVHNFVLKIPKTCFFRPPSFKQPKHQTPSPFFKGIKKFHDFNDVLDPRDPGHGIWMISACLSSSLNKEGL